MVVGTVIGIVVAAGNFVSVAGKEGTLGMRDGEEEENRFEETLLDVDGRRDSFLLRPVIENSCERGDFNVCCCCCCGG